MTDQAYLRDLVVSELLAAKTLAGQDVQSPGDWPSADQNMPIIKVNDTHDDKVSETRTGPNFTVTSYIRIQAQLRETTEKEAQKKIDLLRQQIEKAVIRSYAINLIIQQISSVKTVKEITSESAYHIARIDMQIGFEHFQSMEDFDTLYQAVDLKSVHVTVDMIDVADHEGTYADPPFPGAVKPAPRTEGPDGRAEGTIIKTGLDGN